METQNHTSCKRNYTLLFILHFRGTNHIAGSRLSIGKAGGYSKEQDKKKRKTSTEVSTLNSLGGITFKIRRRKLVISSL